jgi:hypothetical protein
MPITQIGARRGLWRRYPLGAQNRRLSHASQQSAAGVADVGAADTADELARDLQHDVFPCSANRCSYGWARAIAVREAVRIVRRSNREHAAGLADLPQPGDPMLAVEVRAVLERLLEPVPAGRFCRDDLIRPVVLAGG